MFWFREPRTGHTLLVVEFLIARRTCFSPGLNADRGLQVP